MALPLCVDLDGTLIKSDLLLESFLLLIKRNPLYLFSCMFWLCCGGIAYLKQQIAARVQIDPALLPYNQPFLDFLRHEKSQGRQLVLVTAADRFLAHQVAAHLGIFSDVFASDGCVNLKAKQKRDLLDHQFGVKQYDYAGDHRDDLTVWQHAHAAILVNPSQYVVRKVKKMNLTSQVFSDKINRFKSTLKLLRVHQYVKNILVFVPLVVGHDFNLTAIVNSCLAFVVFCLLASSAYLLNDLLDIEADRQHRTKNKRAFAAGDISIKFGLICSPLFLIAAYFLASYLPTYFLLTMTGYYVLTILYSFYFKKKMLVDVFVLAILYTVRILAGVAAAQTEYSPWLITFSIFLFLSLAFVKRYSELDVLEQENKISSASRGYLVSDLPQLRVFGTVSGYISVLVLALYINSNNVAVLYHFSMWLWAICLLLLYWISRVWMLTTRGELHDDPVVFALRDKISWMVILLTGGIIIMATM